MHKLADQISLMNLTGHWTGHYTYGEGYPQSVIGNSEKFEIELIDNNGAITGTCIDSVVRAKEGNECYLIGTFRENKITFKKRYRFHMVIDEPGIFSEDIDDVKSDGVDYTGKYYKGFLSRRIRFSGEWSITSEYTDENGRVQTFIVKGSWKMKKMR
jgi:hypothetical protein